MININEVIEENGFLKTLFEAIPCRIMVVDRNRRVLTINNYGEQRLSISKDTVIEKSIGDVLRCINAQKNPDACGHTESCKNCQVLSMGLRVLEGNKLHRQRAKIRIKLGEKFQDRIMLISAAPIEYMNEQMAIVLLEDITELSELRRQVKMNQNFGGLIGRDVKILKLFEAIEELSRVTVSVLIQGESGTGKELVATAIHNEGVRAHEPFVAVNCGALPETLLESELFGHVKGAFTGAIRDKKGRFELADGGTIFLDEITDISTVMQVKLLRVLQEGTFERLGSEKTTKVNVRVISATNKNIVKEVTDGRFREDLYYRLCVVPLFIPPLRERRDDIPLLADHILREAVANAGREPVVLSPAALNVIMNYEWPGNVRELQNTVHYALVKCRGQVIEREHLPPHLSNSYAIEPRLPKRKRKRKLNSQSVQDALSKTGGNKVEAARLLGVSRATLYRFLDDVEISE